MRSKSELGIAENFDLEIEKIEKRISESGRRTERRKLLTLHNQRLKVGEQLSAEIVDLPEKPGH
jgi:DNA repair protein RecN (Recombination protein N)